MQQSKIFSVNKTLNVAGRLIDLRQPRVMGILNITPDSFYKDSRFNADNVLDQVEQMLKEGADFLDVGGYSSRPNAVDIPVEEELKRVIPVVKAIKHVYPDAIVSVDTFRSAVARQSIEAGADLINDISAGILDDKMFAVVGQAGVPYIMMHMRGTPQTMRALTEYENLLKEMVDYFHQRVFLARQAGIKDFILDPGFGFAKTAQQNFQLLHHLKHFDMLELPMLAGISRKSMIWNTLGIEPTDALNGTTALNMMALMNGASILRVHDVKPAIECIKLYQQTIAHEN
jgi:dihydropteroate synthase